jgi:hypothetical protein
MKKGGSMGSLEDRELGGLIRRASFLTAYDQFRLVDSVMRNLEQKDPYWASRVHIEGLPRLPAREQIHISSRWGSSLRPNRRLAQKVCYALIKSIDPRSRIESWMESRFEKDRELTPKRVAYESFYHFRVNRKMMPYLIATAQRVKRRVMARMRKILKEEFGYYDFET